jgi:molybdenum cofactor cytidylyltransferase
LIKRNKISCGVVILAAGNSSRMGSVKSFLKFDGKNVFIEKVIDEYLDFGCKRIIIIKRADHWGWRKIINKYSNEKSIFFINNNSPELERFYSLSLGVGLLRNIDYCFVQNSDNPFVNGKLLDKIYAEREFGDYILPTFQNRGGHPILIGNNIINELKSYSYKGNLRTFLNNFQRFEIETNDENILVNINTKEEYQQKFESKMQYA